MEIKQEMKNYIMRAVQTSTSDDLERANHAFKGLSGDDLNSQFGQSGLTCKEIWDGYKEERKLNQACVDYLNGVFKS